MKTKWGLENTCHVVLCSSVSYRAEVMPCHVCSRQQATCQDVACQASPGISLLQFGVPRRIASLRASVSVPRQRLTDGKHAFSAPGYARNGIIKHEVGHNYGLGHNRALGGPFGTPGKEDGWDTGSSMGGGVIFGTADRYMLGWINGDALQDVGEFPLPGSGEEFGNPKLLAYWDRVDLSWA